MTQTIHMLLKAQAERIAAIIEEVEKVTVGKEARIVSEYNGQPHGSSRPSQQGRVVTIEGLIFGDFDKNFQFKVQGENLFLNMEELEFIDG